jgi:hypothetical protein
MQNLGSAISSGGAAPVLQTLSYTSTVRDVAG